MESIWVAYIYIIGVDISLSLFIGGTLGICRHSSAENSLSGNITFFLLPILPEAGKGLL